MHLLCESKTHNKQLLLTAAPLAQAKVGHVVAAAAAGGRQRQRLGARHGARRTGVATATVDGHVAHPTVEGDAGAAGRQGRGESSVVAADHGAHGVAGLVVRPIAADDGWCDDPADPAYNRPVRLAYPARCETMTRADGLYDVVVVLGHNDDPPVPGAGSAIFLHCAAPDFAPTEGCVALARDALLALVAAARPGDGLEVRAV